MKNFYQTLSYLTFITLFISCVSTANAQSFTNGIFDKASYAALTASQLPDGWQKVPSADINCQASASGRDTPDLVDLTNSSPASGIHGNPQAGNYYVSGMYAAYAAGVFHEGIQQSVSGFTIGIPVTISLYQTVDKALNCLDQSGGWDVYFDDTWAGTTASSSSILAYNSNSLVWDHRTVTFTPTATTHTIKFLPYDADGDHGDLNSNQTETLRIGIDNVSIIAILPIKLTQFDIDCQNEIPVLTWTTVSETSNDYFTIERSSDAINFEPVGTVRGNGSSSISYNYTWKDNNPIYGTVYYRLKQTDFNGAFEYHGVRTVSCEPTTKISIYPNPFKNDFMVQLSENTTYPITIEVIDYLGKTVYAQEIVTRSAIVNLNRLPANTYFVKIFNEKTQVVERIVKMK